MRRASVLGAIWAAASVCGLVIDEPNIGISKKIPKEGETVKWLIPVLNEAEQAYEGEVRASMRVARRGRALGAPVVVSKSLKLEPGESEDFGFEWRAERNGFHRAAFELVAPECRVTREVAVTKDDVWFVWFGAPKDFKWCNIPTTVRPDDEAWWLRRGAIPAGWKGGVCYKKWPVERFVENWGAADRIAIDEVGGPGEDTDKFIEAWRRLKRQKPHQWIAVWFMGAHHYWADVKDVVDLFVPEIYLNYRGNNLGQYDSYFRVTREAGVMDRMIPGLGINEVKDKKTKRVKCSPTKQDVLRQIRYVKRTAPELKGIGFFTSGGAAWGVAEYADELCGAYYVKPVLTICDAAAPLRVSGAPVEERRTVSVTLKNVGNMDAEDVLLEWRWGGPDRDARVRQERVDFWRVGEEKTSELAVVQAPGWTQVRFRVQPADGYTVLDGAAASCVVRLPAECADGMPVVIPADAPKPAARVRFAPVASDGPFEVLELDSGAVRRLEVPCAVLPPRPGMTERLAAFALDSQPRGSRVVVLRPGPAREGGGPSHSREGGTLTVRNDFYEAQLDLALDHIVALTPAAGAANLLRGPWAFKAAGREGFGEPRVESLPGCLIVTIPYDSARASGESQYVFFGGSSAIRIARSWAPKGEVAMKGAGDSGGLFQKAGTYALQPGVGGPVRRGRLRDGSKYRDLLFGYLGDPPRPDNADRAGWLDFCYGAEGFEGGFGVVVEYRWRDACARSYDVTRLHDAGDWIEVPYVWGQEATIGRPQKSCIHLVPHGRLDFTDGSVTAPAQELWRQLHARQLRRVEE